MDRPCLISSGEHWWAPGPRLVGFRRRQPASCFYARKLCFAECGAENNASRPHLQPYAGLADVWHDYATHFPVGLPNIPREPRRTRRITLRSILDLACGEGTLSTRLARIAPEVVGLDVSEPMLVQAQSRSSELPGVRYAFGATSVSFNWASHLTLPFVRVTH